MSVCESDNGNESATETDDERERESDNVSIRSISRTSRGRRGIKYSFRLYRLHSIDYNYVKAVIFQSDCGSL